jgi:hypothetical protein
LLLTPSPSRLCSYRIIEISQPLSEKQKAVARKHGHRKIVEIVNQSIFDWEERVMEPCAFIAMEVLVRSRARRRSPLGDPG